MVVYLDVLVLLNFAINYCLLAAVDRLTGAGTGWVRLVLGAALGAIYAGFSVLPSFSFLGNNGWRAVFLGLMAMTSFGFRKETIRRAAVLLVLSFALGGLALGLQLKRFFPLLAAGAGGMGAIMALCRGNMGHGGQLVPVTIRLGEKVLHLTALRDTGNTLRDPFSGESVLVVQGESAKELLGPVNLSDPAEAAARWKGKTPCRLIPYRAIGGGGLLLAVRCDGVTVAGRRAGSMVAFSPQPLSPTGAYQALTGGGQYG